MDFRERSANSESEDVVEKRIGELKWSALEQEKESFSQINKRKKPSHLTVIENMI